MVRLESLAMSGGRRLYWLSRTRRWICLTKASSKPSACSSARGGGRCGGRAGAALVDHQMEQLVDSGVLEAELFLVRLALPEVGGGGLLDHRGRQPEIPGEGEDLGLVEVPERVEGVGHVAVDGPVAEQQLGLVGGPDHQRCPRQREVVEDRDRKSV